MSAWNPEQVLKAIAKLDEDSISCLCGKIHYRDEFNHNKKYCSCGLNLYWFLYINDPHYHCDPHIFAVDFETCILTAHFKDGKWMKLIKP